MAEETKANEAAEAQDTPETSEELAADKAETTDVVDAKEEASEDVADVSVSKIGVGNLDFLTETRSDHPDIKPGMVVRVFYRVIEGGKERIQVFEGTVIAIKNRTIAKNITVRKTSFGIAVERIFPLNSKLVEKIEVKKRQKVRRAKLYYLRNLKGKAARLKELR